LRPTRRAVSSPPARRAGNRSSRRYPSAASASRSCLDATRVRRHEAFELTRRNSNALSRTRRGMLATPDFPLRQIWRLRRRRDPARRVGREPSNGARSRGCRPAAAVRSTPPYRAAGSGAPRFIAASPCRVIRVPRSSYNGAGHDGCRRNYPLLAAGAAGFEQSDTSRCAKPDAAGRHPHDRALPTALHMASGSRSYRRSS
jgi:hypothetical protein